MKNLKQFLIVGTTILVFAFYFSSNHPVSSSVTDNISGYAWEADGPSSADIGGTGWISFNCTSGGDCNTSNYGVNIDDFGDISGYAWSSNYGWIKFGGLSGFPTGSGTQAQNANLNGNNVKGWARACAVFQSGCSGDYYHGFGSVDNNLATNPYLSGWDGWISLSGDGYSVTVDRATGNFNSCPTCFAWGGSDAVGWLDFSQVTTNSGLLGIDFYAEPSAAYPPNYKTRLFWSGIPSEKVLTNCVAESGPPLNPSAIPTWNGSVAGTPPQASLLVDTPYNPTDYRISCTDQSTGNPVSASVSVSRSPFPQELVSLSSNGVTDNKTTLSWVTTNIVFNSCTASGGWSGTKSTLPDGSEDGAGSEADVDVPSTAPLFTTYTLTCTGSYTGNPVSKSIDLNENSAPTRIIPRFIER